MAPYRCSEAEVTRGVHHNKYSHTPMAAESGTDAPESGAPADNSAFPTSLFATWGATTNFPIGQNLFPGGRHSPYAILTSGVCIIMGRCYFLHFLHDKKYVCKGKDRRWQKSLFAVFPSHDFGLKLQKWELDHIWTLGSVQIAHILPSNGYTVRIQIRANQVYAYSSLYALTSCFFFLTFFCFIFFTSSFHFIFFLHLFSFVSPFRFCCFIINMLRADPDRFPQFPCRDRFFFPTCIFYFPLENLFLALPNYFAFYLMIANYLICRRVVYATNTPRGK